MQSSGISIGRPANNHDIVDVLRRRGPFLTVHLGTDPAQANAAQHALLRWREMRERAAQAGAPDPALDAVESLVADAHQTGRTLIAIADDSGTLLCDHSPDLDEMRDGATWGRLPGCLPLLELRQRRIPHVIVGLDRTGAQVVVVDRDDESATVQVEGEEYPIRKVHGGGWSQRRFQQRAENTWVENARRAADSVDRVVERLSPAIVVVGGDVRAVQAFGEAAGERVTRLLKVVDAGRAPDGSFDPDHPAIASEIESVVRHEEAEILRRFDEERGQDDQAADGIDATVTALQRAQVEMLLVRMPPEEPPRTLCYGSEGTEIGRTPDELRAIGVRVPFHAEAVDVLTRSALLSGAAVHVTGPRAPMREGVGALLRWRD